MLNDAYGRHIEYLRLSVTDRCDFRCFYCLPSSHRGFATPSDWLTADEMVRLVMQFASLGVKHVRLTGGEPLVRKEICEIAQGISNIPGIEELSLSTNASRLAQFASPLHLAGEMIDYCIEQGVTLRFIETMPVGEGGRNASEHYLPLTEIESRLRNRYNLQPATQRGSGPARYFRIDDTPLVVGFITPKSQHFCDTCNRVRLSVTGDLHLCLGQENKLALGSLIRQDASDETLQQAITSAIALKPERHQFNDNPPDILRPMSSLGG
ncbi:MAG: radical SAM protein [Candidatus Thiodiazotropha sp.]